MGVETRLRLARLYLSTDTSRGHDGFGPFVQDAFSGGVDIVQVRDPRADRADVLDALELARAVSYDYQGLVAVNDDATLAAEFSADVLHLGQADGDAGQVKAKLHQWAQLGRSCHSADQIRAALDDDAVDYLFVGPVYATSQNPEFPPLGLDIVREATRLAPPGDPASKPWFAIGGINADNLDEVLAAGARRVCVVSAITKADDPREAARALKDRLRKAWDDDPAMAAVARGAFGSQQGSATLKGSPVSGDAPQGDARE